MVDSERNNGQTQISEDVEKGAAMPYETQEPEMLENSIAREETEHQGLAAASKSLILTEKIIVILLVVGFVLLEAYFVGVSFRDWLDNQDGHNSADVIVRNLNGEVLQLQMPEVFSDGAKESDTPEPFEDFEGGLDLRAIRSVMDGGKKLKAAADLEKYQ